MIHSFFATRQQPARWFVLSFCVLLLLCPCQLTAVEPPKIAELEQKCEQAEAHVLALAAQIDGDMTEEKSPQRAQLRAAVE